MKVMLVNSVYAAGSTGKIVKDLYEQINSADDQAIVCYGRGNSVEDKRIKKIGSDWNACLDAFLSRISGINGIFSNIPTNRLIREVERFSPDIIHLHNLHGYFLNYYRFVEYLKTKGIPVVWTLHDELMYTGNCAYSFSCDRWMTGCSNCPQVKEYPKSWIFDNSKYLYNKKNKLFKNISNYTFVTPSEWLANRVRRSLLNGENIRVIHNGIDVDNVFVPRRNTELYERLNPEHKRIVLTVTDDVNSERKGISYFITLAKMCPEHLFVVVGGNIQNCPVPNLKFIAFTQSQAELAEYYSLSDVFVITSLCDNFPTVCIESLACGTPVIGFNTGGTAETAPLESIGRFSPYGDLNALIQSVQVFLSLDREQVKTQCREYAQNYCSRQRMMRSYLDLYNELSN